ncbi:MAG TPA: large conductance mechanosensitive channel protein MscL [Actinomycetota bacterium]|nr:large conductance mechanosensitive channel protein MscL [Actinomycetota bacterium]
MLKEFKEFVSRGNLIELAVAVILGLAFAAVVDVFTKGIIGGLIGAIFGGANFAALNITTDNGATIAIGSFIGEVVNFLIVAFVLFLVIKAYNRAFPKKEAAAGPTEIELLTQIRDELRLR